MGWFRKPSLSQTTTTTTKYQEFIQNFKDNIETLLWSGKALITGSSDVRKLFG